MILAIFVINSRSSSRERLCISTISFNRQEPTLQGTQPILYSLRISATLGNWEMTSFIGVLRYFSIFIYAFFLNPLAQNNSILSHQISYAPLSTRFSLMSGRPWDKEYYLLYP